MAKHNAANAANNNDGRVFEFTRDNASKVSSTIYTFKMAGPDGKEIVVPKSALQTKRIQRERMPDGTIKETEVDDYRFVKSRYVPAIAGLVDDAITRDPATMARLNAMSEDDLVQAVLQFKRDLEAFDACDAFQLPNGKQYSRSVYGPIVNDGAKDAKPISAVAYILRCIAKEHRLGTQKQLQGPQRDEAERVLRAELGIDAPVGKPKRAGKVQGEVIDEDDDMLA